MILLNRHSLVMTVRLVLLLILITTIIIADLSNAAGSSQDHITEDHNYDDQGSKLMEPMRHIDTIQDVEVLLNFYKKASQSKDPHTNDDEKQYKLSLDALMELATLLEVKPGLSKSYNYVDLLTFLSDEGK